MKATQRINGVIVVCSMAILGMSERSYSDSIDRRTFLLKENAVFVMRLEAYQHLLQGAEINGDITERIEDLIKSEIQSFDDWAKLYFNQTALPAGVPKISPLAEEEHYSKIKSLLSQMRTTLMGFHRDLGNDSSLIEKIEVIKKIARKLDKLLDDEVSAWERIFKVPDSGKKNEPMERPPLKLDR